MYPFLLLLYGLDCPVDVLDIDDPSYPVNIFLRIFDLSFLSRFYNKIANYRPTSHNPNKA